MAILRAYWSFDNPPGSLLDKTGNGFDLQSNTGSVSAIGQCDTSYLFNGTGYLSRLGLGRPRLGAFRV